MNTTAKFLPLGSAVTITDDEGTYVIIARGFQKHEDGFLAGYKAVPHPQGAATGVREIVIRESQITKVLHRGYEDASDAKFATDQLEHAKTPPKTPAAPAPEPDLTVDLAAPATTTSAASAPPGTDRAPSPATPVVVSDPTDPFKELRSKGKRP